jgi:hypothetical protein
VVHGDREFHGDGWRRLLDAMEWAEVAHFAGSWSKGWHPDACLGVVSIEFFSAWR